jgi:hypothetical protein
MASTMIKVREVAIAGMRFILPVILMVAAGSCGNDDDAVAPGSSGTVQGTLTLPGSALGKEWVVIVDNDFNGDNGWVAISSGTCGSSLTMEFTVSNVPPGTYYVYALVRLVSGSTESPQTGDYMGIHGGTLSNPPHAPTLTVVSEGSASCNIELGVYSS